MKINYKSNKLKKQMESAAAIKRYFGVNAKRVSQRLAEMEASPNLAVLQMIPAANCHMLRGNRNSEWAVDISGNYRIIFDIDHDPLPLTPSNEIDAIKITDIRILDTADYH